MVGAWLSDSELVVAPEDWFKGSENADKDTSDITPKSWMRI